MTRKIRPVKIGTHNGRFHCDEVLACAMLQQLPEYKNAQILRTREMPRLEECDVIVDVGGVFNPDQFRFDHHMPTFDLTIANFFPDVIPHIKLSSAGLVYAIFGHRIIGQIISKPESDPDVNVLFKQFYKSFIAEVDAFDNGVPIADGNMKYQIYSDMCRRVGDCNPPWNRPELSERECFNKALDLVKAEFIERLQALNDHWLPARDLVKEAIEQRHSCHPSGLIVRLTNQGCPWKEHFYALEKELVTVDAATAELDPEHAFKQQPVFVLAERREQYSVICIPTSTDAPFSKRVSFPESWAGKRDVELDDISGVPGCVFVHTNLFMAINKTYEGALAMACKTLRLAGYIE